jgi:hypothetical protein
MVDETQSDLARSEHSLKLDETSAVMKKTGPVQQQKPAQP